MTARDLLRWWGGQLVACLPGRLAEGERQLHRLPRLVLLSPPGAMPVTLELTRTLPGAALRREVLSLGAAEAGRLRAALGPPPARGWRRPAGLCLRLPAGQLLACDVALPLAAEPSLEQVLGFEFDRLTPFRAADALWSHLILEVTPRVNSQGW